MGLSKEERRHRRMMLRAIKTVFFLISMLISLLLFSAPLLLVIADALLPSAILSAISPSPLSLQNLSSHFRHYDFRRSLLDIPLVSIIRSFLIFCVYSWCDGRRLSGRAYVGVTTACSVLSVIFVSWKAVYYVLGGSGGSGSGSGRGRGRALQIALFLCSYVLAVGHVVVAYRTSCRERRKLLVYKIDIEAISACKNGHQRYPKILRVERVK